MNFRFLWVSQKNRLCYAALLGAWLLLPAVIFSQPAAESAGRGFDERRIWTFIAPYDGTIGADLNWGARFGPNKTSIYHQGDLVLETEAVGRISWGGHLHNLPTGASVRTDFVSEFFPCMRNYTAVRAYLNGLFEEFRFSPLLLLPGDPETWGMRMFFIQGDEEESAMNVELYVADRKDAPSVLYHSLTIPDYSERQLTITCEYLEGSSLYGRPPESISFARGTPPSVTLDYLVTWGMRIGRPYEAAFPEGPFNGPIRMSVHLDGFTTDTIEFIKEPTQSLFLTVVLTPDGMTSPPSTYPVENLPANISDNDFYLGATEDLLGKCECFPGAKQWYLDHNEDGPLDCADLVERARTKRSEW